MYLDLFHNSNVITWNNTFNAKYTYNSDSIHLNNAGHEKYLYPIIRDTLERVRPI